MKINVLSFLSSVALLSFASCTDEAQELANEQSQVLKQIVMTTQDFQTEVAGRTLYDINDEAIKCTWAANDTVGVFPNEGAQVFFPMASGAGTKNATFNGGGWALKDGSTYAAYYPCIGKFYLEKNAVPVSYIGQTQKGNASTAHLGAFDYMVATPATSEFGSAHFTFKHLSALIQLRITVPQPATLTSVKLVTDTEAFAVKGEVDIMADAPSIKPVDSAKEIVLDLQNVATTKENQVVTFYMMIPPVDLSGQTLKVMVSSDKGADEIAFEGKKFASGIAYGLSGELKTKEGGYKDGVVTLAEAGSMSKLLENDWLSITSLKVVGPINGDDVRCLRQMLGGSEFSDEEKGNLVSLDLSEASIVEGGEWYSEFKYKYYTSNDVIGNYMFCQCDNLQNIMISKTVTTICENAFSDCSSLISIDVPNGVTAIENYVFSRCSSLTTIDIPNSVTSIGEGTFSDCSSLISIDVPDGVTIIENHAFSRCFSLTSIDIPTGVTSIGEGAFSDCSSLISIDVPNGVTAIENYVFSRCSSLTTIDIPNSVTSIGEGTFSDCSSLISIDVPDGVTTIENHAFSRCSSLTTIDIPNGVTSIGFDAFSSCSSLTAIDISNGVTLIGDGAFYGCSSLTSIDIPASVTSIGAGAFIRCFSLASIKIPASVTSIEMRTFESCSSLTSIDIPAGVTSIGGSAFSGCSSLSSVYITDLSAWCKIKLDNYDSNPLNCGANLYLNNKELTELVIPADVKQIKNYAFTGCNSITKVTMGDDVTSISISAFQNCSSLASVSIGAGVTSVGKEAFKGCPSLTKVQCHAIKPAIINITASYSSFDASGNKTLYVPSNYVANYKTSNWANYFPNIVEME